MFNITLIFLLFFISRPLLCRDLEILFVVFHLVWEWGFRVSCRLRVWLQLTPVSGVRICKLLELLILYFSSLVTYDLVVSFPEKFDFSSWVKSVKCITKPFIKKKNNKLIVYYWLNIHGYPIWFLLLSYMECCL